MEENELGATQIRTYLPDRRRLRRSNIDIEIARQFLQNRAEIVRILVPAKDKGAGPITVARQIERLCGHAQMAVLLEQSNHHVVNCRAGKLDKVTVFRLAAPINRISHRARRFRVELQIRDFIDPIGLQAECHREVPGRDIVKS